MGASLADHRQQRLLLVPGIQQYRGQQRQIFVFYCPLERNAGSGDDEWLMGAAVSSTCLIKDGSSHQIRKGLANSGARIADGDFPVQQSI